MDATLFYFKLMWFYVFVMFCLMLLMCYLFYAKKRAQKIENRSLAFSRQVIEGMEMERLRISRELHDVILPQVQDSPVSCQIRTICSELMPPDFSRLSLNALFADICNKFSNRTGVKCNTIIENELMFSELSAENQLHLYRMVQESFTNIEKHSEADEAMLVVRRNDDNILICISDDGVGLKSNEEGLGMKNLRQRAAIVGAKLDFISEIQNGLMVRIELPLRAIQKEGK